MPTRVARAPWAVVPIVVVTGLGSSQAGLWSDLGWGLFFTLTFALPCACLGVLGLGLPVFWLLRRVERERSPVLHLMAAVVPSALFLDAGFPGPSVLAGISGFVVSLVAMAAYGEPGVLPSARGFPWGRSRLSSQ